ncbi:DUF3558 family protein [Saccharopolyspora erythraea]|uniref:DUF3558 family protein n=1 Tax=Saccharopolyspora erythraea TaxID=1836 RepID=UPI002012EB74|nr:DUF3558 family protein [Saccharopolyspora erythraea]
MAARIRNGLVGMAAIGLVAGGCTVNGPESPTPATSTSAESSRSKDLAVVGKPDADLCDLLTPEQQTALGVGGARPNAETDELTETDYPGCAWRRPLGEEPAYGIRVYAVPEGIKDFMGKISPAFPETEASYTVGNGFPAMQAQRGESLEQLGCMVGVDVADGQTLGVFASPGVSQVMSNQDICAKAKAAAEAAVTTLQSQG